jgi:hypothetical protein
MRRPQRVGVSQWAIVIPVAVVLLICGAIGVFVGKDDDKAGEVPPETLVAAPSPASSPSAVPTPSNQPSGDVPGYLAALKGIHRGLVTNEKTAETRGRNTCLDITQGKPQSIVVNNARQRFAGAVSVDQAMAAKIVAVVQTYLCPAAVIAADPPAQPTTTAGNDNGGGNDDGGDGVYYPNCAAVRAAGKAPLHRGEPGYRSGLDRDGDGTACDT